MKKALAIITLLIVSGSAIVCIASVIPGEGNGYIITSQWGEKVEMHGQGVYARESHSYAIQAIAQDWVTLIIGIPLLLASLLMTLRNSYRGKLLLTGMLGYFLYTYASYSFLINYNRFFLVYVSLFSLSLFGFIVSYMQLDVGSIKTRMKPGFPRKALAIFMMLIGLMLVFMWLGRILPSLKTGKAPYGLENYTTLVIQALDLGVIAPAAVLTAVNLLKNNPTGYALSTVIALKGAALFSAVSAMAVLMKVNGIEINAAEMIIFLVATLINFLFCFLIMRNVKTESSIR